MRLDEYRNTLTDIWWDFFNFREPKELNFLNFATQTAEVQKFDPEAHFEITISISNNVYYQQRVVYDALMALGDVGGLAEVFLAVFAGFMSLFTGKFYLASLVQSLFNSANGESDPVDPDKTSEE